MTPANPRMAQHFQAGPQQKQEWPQQLHASRDRYQQEWRRRRHGSNKFTRATANTSNPAPNTGTALVHSGKAPHSRAGPQPTQARSQQMHTHTRRNKYTLDLANADMDPAKLHRGQPIRVSLNTRRHGPSKFRQAATIPSELAANAGMVPANLRKTPQIQARSCLAFLPGHHLAGYAGCS